MYQLSNKENSIIYSIVDDFGDDNKIELNNRIRSLLDLVINKRKIDVLNFMENHFSKKHENIRINRKRV